MSDTEILTAQIPEELAGQRLDQVLAVLFSAFSRARLQRWVTDGRVLVDQQPRRVKDKVRGGEWVEVRVLREVETPNEAQPIALDVIYQDAALLVINKPAGLVVHPAVGNPSGTLLNALLHLAPELAQVPRAGIVHRLDKGTSGLLVVARTLESQNALVQQLQDRSMGREYDAIVYGTLVAGGTVDAPIGRHPTDRLRMAVTDRGKAAVTHYRVTERFRAHTLLRCHLETGRTHQIRVHMTHIRHPLIGDAAYGGRLRLLAGASAEFTEAMRAFPRQALHAACLRLEHPDTGETLEWHARQPADFQALLGALRADRDAHPL